MVFGRCPRALLFPANPPGNHRAGCWFLLSSPAVLFSAGSGGKDKWQSHPVLTKPAGRGRARPFSGLLISKRDLLLFRAGVGKGVAQLSSVLYIIHVSYSC